MIFKLLNILLGGEVKDNAGNHMSKDDRRTKSKYGLSDREMKLVKHGKADPWDFEDEELHDDDYYYDK